ncbi:MAG: RimJ/RimL family protein N-acetyltransferase [Vicingaceae bacterium]|jgi:RimJ/RimL family protein N-acetyltransferase
MERFSVKLEPLTEEAALIVREWRNAARVNQFMDFKDHISIEQQKNWFEQLQKSNDYYFIIQSSEDLVGLIHLNRMNAQLKSAYAGLFVGNEAYEGTGITFQASVLLLDFAFNTLELIEVYAKVHRLNKAALAYNEALGFQPDGTESGDFLRLKLRREEYNRSRQALVSLLPL